MDAGAIQLADGEAPPDPTDWRAIAINRQDNGDYCTLTLIGPDVVLLAAHCVDSGGAAGDLIKKPIPSTVTFSAGLYAMDCSISPDYLKDGYRPKSIRNTADFALCRLNATVSGISPEDIDTQDALAPGRMLLLVGYGCTKVEIDGSGLSRGEGIDKVLRIGKEAVEAINFSLWPPESGIYVRTVSTADTQPVICPGDSGGPAMLDLSGPALATSRAVVAVNSGSGPTIFATQQAPSFYSYFAPLSSNQFRTFLASWMRGHAGVVICGINRKAGISGCRA
jgi:hypothetical protein